MSMNAKCRGSNRLTGAASLRYRMPAFGDLFPTLGYSSWAEQQSHKLSAAGSIPAIQPTNYR